jgi:hypothetical protein
MDSRFYEVQWNEPDRKGEEEPIQPGCTLETNKRR